VIVDIILSTFYIFLLVRLATSSDLYFSSPFYTFFISTGIYSVLTVISYQIVGQFQFSEKYWTVIYCQGVNTFGSKGATIGKAYIAFHRYLVIRSREFSE
ncbi:hypothetical protein PENTCL1PPCAC_25316, partial [Pristionchus entomophagus]